MPLVKYFVPVLLRWQVFLLLPSPHTSVCRLYRDVPELASQLVFFCEYIFISLEMPCSAFLKAVVITLFNHLALASVGENRGGSAILCTEEIMAEKILKNV